MIFIKIIFLENGVKVILFVLSLRRLNKQQKVILKMEDEKITLAEPELPQLRQTVLENTRRISRNEQMIDQMRKKEVEEERKRRERDEFWENVRREHALAQQEHDRDMREIRESLKRTQKLSEENAEGLKETRALVNENAEGLKETRALVNENAEGLKEIRALVNENAEGLKEIRKLSKETHELVKESSKLVKENSELVKENSEIVKKNSEIVKENSELMKKQVEETKKTFREMSIQFMGRTGHIVEGLLSSSAEKVFQEAGFDLYNHGKNLIRKFKSENKQMEVDVLLSNDEFAVPIEVKTNCTREDVRRILHQMELFRDLFPEYADKEVIAAVAAINYEKGVDDLARDEGLLVIRVNSDDIFSLDSFDKEALRRF